MIPHEPKQALSKINKSPSSYN